ncbi:hypothetical protein LNQ81_09160 [Myroides sp. M-43]|uniref:hypothetical protein n=1 Tax=Myroides oncorhynchi TaxID=2893756 RepID=UPI001E5BD92C|nr:hypothetical protein [Myroides oncorhynchi]MCC9042843.1 hypothetical protein [Myroides oncorhynchi]
MNFDDLEKSWQEQEAPNVKVSSKDLDVKSSRLPLEKIRKNVVKDIWVQGVSIVFLAFLPLGYSLSIESMRFYYIIYFLFAVITIYFLAKMYLFYRTSASFTMNSRDSLYEVYFSVRMYIQLYENFCYSLLPFICVFIPLFVGLKEDDYFDLLQNKVFIIAFIIFFILTLVLVKYWIKKLYGQYLTQIENNLNLFKEQE